MRPRLPPPALSAPSRDCPTPASYGADHILFGADMPYASANGDGNAKQCIAGIEALGVSSAGKERMFNGNLLLRLEEIDYDEFRQRGL